MAQTVAFLLTLSMNGCLELPEAHANIMQNIPGYMNGLVQFGLFISPKNIFHSECLNMAF
jgi:hypothetical protein